MKRLARFSLTWLARMILRRYHPIVVGVAGSVGKTATKEAISAGLQTGSRSVRQTSGSFNADVGVPVTVISGGPARQSTWQWLGVVLAGIGLLVRRQSYPDVLVLELGTDQPGDLARLVRLAHPTIGVLTAIAPEHLEFFSSLEGVAEEEATILKQLGPEQTAVANIDTPEIESLMHELQTKQVSYGWSAKANVRATGVTLIQTEQGLPRGMIITVSVGPETFSVTLPGVIGRHQVYPVLAAIAVGQALGDAAAETVRALSGYRPPAGRMQLVAGINGSLLIDDSYNASPYAMREAITTLASLENPGRKHLILGQMSELGASAQHWHEEIGALLGQPWVATLVTVGPLAAVIGQTAVARGLSPDHVYNVPTAEAAAAKLQAVISPSDAILIKGSRYAAHLERAVSVLAAQPE